jgi:ribonuclease HI
MEGYEHNSRLEVTKSAILHFTRKTIQDPDADNSRIPVNRPPLVLEGQVVQEVESYKYLGVQIDARLRWKEQVQRATANATKWILQFRRLTRPSTGVKTRLMRQLYLAVALPKITYGIEVWYMPPTKPAGYTRNTGSAGALQNLQKIQQIATLAITGTLRMSPNNFVDAHAGVLPMELAPLKACHSALVRSLTLPSTNPMHHVVQMAKRSQPKKHPGPATNMLRILGLGDMEIETIYPAVTLKSLGPQHRVEIDDSREESISSEHNDNTDYKIFTDGSGQGGGIGAVAILYKKGRVHPLKLLQFFMGTTGKHNIFEAETRGAILALQILESTPATVGRKVSLYINNQSVATALIHPKATSGQHLLSALHSAIEGTGCRLVVRWISGHSKVKGNEEADRIAKNTAEGYSSASASLPQILRDPLPTSASAR